MEEPVFGLCPLCTQQKQRRAQQIDAECWH